MDATAWASIAAVAVTFLLGMLTVRATKRSTVDAKAAADLEARDRMLDARNKDVEARDRFIDQVQEERDRLAGQLHEALERIDMLTGQSRLLEEQIAKIRQNPPML